MPDKCALQMEVDLPARISQHEPVNSTLCRVEIYTARFRLKTCHPEARVVINQRMQTEIYPSDY